MEYFLKWGIDLEILEFRGYYILEQKMLVFWYFVTTSAYKYMNLCSYPTTVLMNGAKLTIIMQFKAISKILKVMIKTFLY